MRLSVFNYAKNSMKLLGSSETKLYFIVLIFSMAMKLSVPERQIKIIVLSQRKMFQLSLYDFGGHILFYMYDHFKLFP